MLISGALAPGRINRFKQKGGRAPALSVSKVRGRVLRFVPVVGLRGGGQDPDRAGLYSTCATGMCRSARLPRLLRGFPATARRCVRRDFLVDFACLFFAACLSFWMMVLCGHVVFLPAVKLLVGGCAHPPSWLSSCWSLGCFEGSYVCIWSRSIARGSSLCRCFVLASLCTLRKLLISQQRNLARTGLYSLQPDTQPALMTRAMQ